MNATTAVYHNMSQNGTPSSAMLSSHPYMSEAMVWGIGTSVTVLAFVGFAENLFVVFLVLFGQGFLEAPSNIFLLNLSTAEMVLCSVGVPLLTASLVHESMVEYFLNAARFAACINVGSIFLLSANQTVSVTYSLRYPMMMTVQRAAFSVAVLWGIACSLMGFSAISYATGIRWLRQLFRCFLIIVLLMTLAINSFLYKRTRNHRQAIQTQLQAVQPARQMTGQDFRAIRALLLVTGTFVVGWLPITLAIFSTNRFLDPETFYKPLYLTSLLTVLNTIADPIIYFFRFDDFKRFYQRQKRRYFSDHGLSLPQRPASHAAVVATSTA